MPEQELVEVRLVLAVEEELVEQPDCLNTMVWELVELDTPQRGLVEAQLVQVEEALVELLDWLSKKVLEVEERGMPGLQVEVVQLVQVGEEVLVEQLAYQHTMALEQVVMGMLELELVVER